MISMPFGRPPPRGTLFETRARLMPSTSPTCFFTEPWADDALLAVVAFRLEAAPRAFVGTAVVRVAPELRVLEDAVFFAKLPPFVALRSDVHALYAASCT